MLLQKARVARREARQGSDSTTACRRRRRPADVAPVRPRERQLDQEERARRRGCRDLVWRAAAAAALATAAGALVIVLLIFLLFVFVSTVVNRHSIRRRQAERARHHGVASHQGHRQQPAAQG